VLNRFKYGQARFIGKIANALAENNKTSKAPVLALRKVNIQFFNSTGGF